ncbi:MAG TPA: hypothetical protein VMT83_11780 [Burkholderiaceae bacterium]|nr:hypothetical protein [Burkholderiaceae bacterium]
MNLYLCMLDTRAVPGAFGTTRNPIDAGADVSELAEREPRLARWSMCE